MKHNSGKWLVRPDYGQENVYRLWDKNSNYHKRTDPETMDANAILIQSAPLLLKALKQLDRAHNHDTLCRAKEYARAVIRTAENVTLDSEVSQ